MADGACKNVFSEYMSRLMLQDTGSSVKRFVARYLIVALLAVTTGSLVALFLWLLQVVTDYRQCHGWLLYLLPPAGVLIYCIYRLAGKNAEQGNNLIIDEIHMPGGGVPARMAPLVLVSTIITHLFGGSAGREGTAVQMGGSMAGMYGRWFRLPAGELRTVLTAGIAAGFGAVFGTPVTGAVFALEVLAIGSMSYRALLPAFFAAIIANLTTRAWGIHHTHYSISAPLSSHTVSWLHIDVSLLLPAALAGIAFGLAARLFAGTTHSLKTFFKTIIPIEWLIPVAGGVIVIALCLLLGTTDYIGLGVTIPNANGVSIVNAFHPGGATYFSWFWKLLLTAITLSSGFKGGEVTPLFFIGATLGNTIALLSGAPVDLFAALGFIAVFAAATNTPIACTIMGIELFGGTYLPYYAIACFAAYYCSGHTGIYTAQRISTHKLNGSPMSETIGTIHKKKTERNKEHLTHWLNKLRTKRNK